MGSETKARGPVLAQSLFSTVHAPRSSWRSHITSGVAHAILILALFLIAVPAFRDQANKKPVETITLIAPQLPEYQPKTVAPSHIQSPTQVTKNVIRPKLLSNLKPPEVKPVKAPKAQLMAMAPDMKATPAVSPEAAIIEPKLAPAPKPAVRTGTFQSADAAKAPPAPKVAKVGGFGDPNGVPPSADSRQSAAMLAKVGSFDLPNGAGNSGGGGRSSSGSVRQTSFGSVGEEGGGGTGQVAGKVRTGAFGETPVAPDRSTSNAAARPIAPVFTPVEILSKPKPVYTAEARGLRLEGQVSLDVVFLSTGSIRIVRIVHGLGHGLDEAAQQAALHVRFRPAMRGGVPVDTNATIHITFELT